MLTAAVAVCLIGIFVLAFEGRLRRTTDARSRETTRHDRGSQRAVSIVFADSFIEWRPGLRWVVGQRSPSSLPALASAKRSLTSRQTSGSKPLRASRA